MGLWIGGPAALQFYFCCFWPNERKTEFIAYLLTLFLVSVSKYICIKFWRGEEGGYNNNRVVKWKCSARVHFGLLYLQ
jgi:hypothetical protein